MIPDNPTVHDQFESHAQRRQSQDGNALLFDNFGNSSAQNSIVYEINDIPKMFSGFKFHISRSRFRRIYHQNLKRTKAVRLSKNATV